MVERVVCSTGGLKMPCWDLVTMGCRVVWEETGRSTWILMGEGE